jgi:hypothetical protein
MARSRMLHVRVDDELKTQASEALAAMGLSVSDAVRILRAARPPWRPMRPSVPSVFRITDAR